MKGVSHREKIIAEQADFISNMIHNNPTDLISLEHFIIHGRIAGRRSKPESIAIVLEQLKATHQINNPLITMLSSALIKRNIGEIKIDRPLIKIANKKTGGSIGYIAHKAPKNSTDNNEIKHAKRIVIKSDKVKYKKTGETKSTIEEIKEELIFEYLGSQLANIFLPHNSPKFRLHQNSSTKEIYGASTFIENFETIADIKKNAKAANHPEELITRLTNAEGFANIFATSLLLGDYDLNFGNIGLILDENKQSYFARIDFGRAFSYGIDFDWKTKNYVPINGFQTAEGFKARVAQLYPDSLLHGIKFASELYQAANNFDETAVRQAIKISIDNLKSLYGKDFLNDELMKLNFLKRMNISVGTALTEELVENKALENMLSLNIQLKKIALKEIMTLMNSQVESTRIAAFSQLNIMQPNFALFIRDSINQKDFDIIELFGKSADCYPVLVIEDIVNNSTTQQLEYLKEHAPLCITSYIRNALQQNGETAFKQIDTKISNTLAFYLSHAISQNYQDDITILNQYAPDVLFRFLKEIIDNDKGDKNIITRFNDEMPSGLDPFIKAIISENDNNYLEYLNTHVPSCLNIFIRTAIKQQDSINLELLNLKTPDRMTLYINSAAAQGHYNEILFLNEYLPEATDLFVRRSITLQDIPSLNQLKTKAPACITSFLDRAERTDLDYLKQLNAMLPNFKITGVSLLKYIVNQNKTELAAAMIHAGFTFEPSEIPVSLKSHQPIKQIFGWFTERDVLRSIIIETSSPRISEQDFLSKKPSPVYLALKTGKYNLASYLVENDFTLKHNELPEFNLSFRANTKELKNKTLEYIMTAKTNDINTSHSPATSSMSSSSKSNKHDRHQLCILKF